MKSNRHRGKHTIRKGGTLMPAALICYLCCAACHRDPGMITLGIASVLPSVLTRPSRRRQT